MGLISGFKKFFGVSTPKEALSHEELQNKLHRSFAMQSFIAGTLGYSFYYVCRAAINVMKKPIIDSGLLDADQLGTIGAVSLATYAIGKFVNGFLADYSNIKRFMATGLIISALACFLMGVAGLIGAEQYSALIGVDAAAAQKISFFVFIAFAILWGLSGWAQSMGSPPAIIALSRWFPLSRRGTFYGFFSASHNIGEGLSFIFVGSIVAAASWQWGFFGAAIAGVIGILIILFMMHDTPESKGLPSIEVFAKEKSSGKDASSKEAQKIALRTPAVWILALASAFMYISRYSLNSWGVLFMQEEKGFELLEASAIISINAWMGVIGTVLAGWMSDSLFKGDRKIPAFVAGILLSISYAMFIYGGDTRWMTIASMALFGIAIGVLIAFLGGLMAVDIVPRKATGAALGIVGMVSYAAASIQEKVSGWLINKNKVVSEEALTPETKEMLEKIVNVAGETTNQLVENINNIEPKLIEAGKNHQVSNDLIEAFAKLGDQVRDFGAKEVDGAEKISEEVLKLAQSALESGKIEVVSYDFSEAAIFWIGASVISFLLPILLWGKKVKNEGE